MKANKGDCQIPEDDADGRRASILPIVNYIMARAGGEEREREREELSRGERSTVDQHGGAKLERYTNARRQLRRRDSLIRLTNIGPPMTKLTITSWTNCGGQLDGGGCGAKPLRTLGELACHDV